MSRLLSIIGAVTLLSGVSLTACGSSGGKPANSMAGGGTGATGAGGSQTTAGDVAVTISPKMANAYEGGEVQFTATVTGTSNMDVTWSIEESGTDGSISADGVLTAPTGAGLYHVVVKSAENEGASDRATVAVSKKATGEPGVWENVTPPGVVLDKSINDGNFGVQEIEVDPANPANVYLSVCYQGIWKSTDYGLTFSKVSEDGGPMDNGRPWAMGIDHNPDRDPKTPPVLYSTQGYGNMQGFYVSKDDGKTWTHHSMGSDNDIGSMAVDPNDVNHIIAGMRASKHVMESRDGGETWTSLGEAGTANSNHVYFINSTTYMIVAETHEGADGTRISTDSGKTWSKVSTCERFHGSSQPYMDGAGLIVSPCVEGILKSTDWGKTWEKVAEGASSAVAATGTYLYVATGWATQGEWDPNMRRAEKATAADWASYTEKPAGMSNGPHRVAVTFDGEKHVVVSANWLAGVWRYVEP
jgi:hypothetical protein